MRSGGDLIEQRKFLLTPDGFTDPRVLAHELCREVLFFRTQYLLETDD